MLKKTATQCELHEASPSSSSGGGYLKPIGASTNVFAEHGVRTGLFKNIIGRQRSFDAKAPVIFDDQRGLWMSAYHGGLLSGNGRRTGIPAQLWDTSNENYLNLVTCDAHLKIYHVDDSTGRFECRLRCDWAFRMPQTRGTEPRVRVPGIRMSSLSCTTEESRVWRERLLESSTTMFFEGCSVFTFVGFEVMQVHDFPFDRQVLDLGVLEFVWRRDKDTDNFEEEMKVVRFTLMTETTMPRWQAWRGLILPLNEKSYFGPDSESDSESELRPIRRPGSKEEVPGFATRFGVKLRLQRHTRYYVIQLFMMTWMITVGSLMSLGMHAHAVGKRSEILAMGLLTLIGFKFSVAEHLPRVSYQTYADKYLQLQVIVLCIAACVVVLQYRLEWEFLSWALLAVGVVGSTVHFFLVLWKERQPWNDVLSYNKYLVDTEKRVNRPSVGSSSAGPPSLRRSGTNISLDSFFEPGNIDHRKSSSSSFRGPAAEGENHRPVTRVATFGTLEGL